MLLPSLVYWYSSRSFTYLHSWRRSEVATNARKSGLSKESQPSAVIQGVFFRCFDINHHGYGSSSSSSKVGCCLDSSNVSRWLLLTSEWVVTLLGKSKLNLFRRCRCLFWCWWWPWNCCHDCLPITLKLVWLFVHAGVSNSFWLRGRIKLIWSQVGRIN